MHEPLVARIGLAAIVAGGIVMIVVGDPGWPVPAMAVGYAAAHAVPVPNPSGKPGSAAPAVAAAAAIATGGSLSVVIGGAAVATPAAWLLVRLQRGRGATDAMYPAEPAGLTVFALIYAGGAALFGSGSEEGMVVLGVLGAATLGWHFTSAAVRALWSQPAHTGPRRLILLQGLRDWPAYAALVASAALFALTVDRLGWWSVPLAGLPYAFSHVALHLVGVTRRTYDQTIRALGRIPEAAGHVDPGHATRTARLAVAVGDQLGLSPWALSRIESAAHLHDMGRVVLGNPRVAAAGYSRSDVAGWSAAIIGETKELEEVAEVVLAQALPYRRHGEHSDPGVSAEARVVRVAARFDAAVAEGLDPIDALELLHRGSAYDYDPVVITALRSVLVRRGEIAA